MSEIYGRKEVFTYHTQSSEHHQHMTGDLVIWLPNTQHRNTLWVYQQYCVHPKYTWMENTAAASDINKENCLYSLLVGALWASPINIGSCVSTSPPTPWKTFCTHTQHGAFNWVLLQCSMVFLLLDSSPVHLYPLSSQYWGL